jgi:hypothetical protein
VEISAGCTVRNYISGTHHYIFLTVSLGMSLFTRTYYHPAPFLVGFGYRKKITMAACPSSLLLLLLTQAENVVQLVADIIPLRLVSLSLNFVYRSLAGEFFLVFRPLVYLFWGRFNDIWSSSKKKTIPS